MIAGILTQVVEFFYAHFVPSPFWYWIGWGLLATFVSGVIGWAFAPLRPFAGAVILAVVAGLTGYRRGEYDQYHRDRGEPRSGGRR